MEFIESISFHKDFKRNKLTDDDLRKIQAEIIRNPEIGDIQIGTDNIRKFRYGYIEDKGKSGGARIHYHIYNDICYLLAFVPKNVAENLTKKERNDLDKLLNRMKNKEESLKNYLGEFNMSARKTLYDYLSQGIQDIIDYNNGDKSKAIKLKVPAIAEGTKLSIEEAEPITKAQFEKIVKSIYNEITKTYNRNDIQYNIHKHNNCYTLHCVSTNLDKDTFPGNEYKITYDNKNIRLTVIIDNEQIDDVVFYNLQDLYNYIIDDVELFYNATSFDK